VAYFAFLIPAQKLVETDTLVAFHHPSPSYPLHILILPKGRYRSLTDLPSDDLRFESDLFTAVRHLVQLFGLQDGSYRLIANGGQAQEVDHLHFHLVSDDYQAELSK
jgi:histidine triad (HIT) family protein